MCAVLDSKCCNNLPKWDKSECKNDKYYNTYIEKCIHYCTPFFFEKKKFILKYQRRIILKSEKLCQKYL